MEEGKGVPGRSCARTQRRCCSGCGAAAVAGSGLSSRSGAELPHCAWRSVPLGEGCGAYMGAGGHMGAEPEASLAARVDVSPLTSVRGSWRLLESAWIFSFFHLSRECPLCHRGVLQGAGKCHCPSLIPSAQSDTDIGVSFSFVGIKPGPQALPLNYEPCPTLSPAVTLGFSRVSWELTPVPPSHIPGFFTCLSLSLQAKQLRLSLPFVLRTPLYLWQGLFT